MKDQYYAPEVIVSGNTIARIYRPILTPEERAKRMQQISEAAGRLLLSVEKAKANTEKKA